MRHPFLCLSLLGLACLSLLAPVRAQSSAPAISEIDLDFRTRYDSYNATGSRLSALTVRIHLSDKTGDLDGSMQHSLNSMV